MKRTGFRLPMNKSEAVVGWIYIFIHTFILGEALFLADRYLFPHIGLSFSDTGLNMLYYAISFAFVLLSMFSFMRDSFRDLCSNFKDTAISVLLGYVLYIACSYVVSALILLLAQELVNPNQAAISAETKLNPNVMLVTSVLLAPVVEEVLFRGVVFGTIKKKSVVLAYIVSSLFFAFYHLWAYFITDFNWTLILYLLQYIPAGIILAWVYSRSRTVWGPIVLHMLINYVSISVTLG